MKVFNLKTVLFSIIGLFGIATSVQASERVVATVDGNPILESQVKRALGKRANNEENRQAALNSLIDDLLVQKAIQQSGIKVNQAQVDQIIEGIAAQNGLTFGQLLDALDYQGINYQAYRKQIANQVIMSEVRNQAIGSSVDVTREEVQALGQKLLEQAKAQGKEKKVTAPEYNVRHILLKLNPLLNDAQAKAQLTQIRSDILANKISFADAALKYSKDYLSGANGGSLGFMFPDAYAPQFAKTIQSTKKGVISAPFKTEFGWHILEVTDVRDGDRTQDAYMQEAYQQIVNQQLQEASGDWVKALRKRANIQYFNFN
ncbi:peptidylprolyl isomerase [Haemophilus haemoglobinophilus]|nr:peptidylprolyl isomerase [Canicola haemoglobinophilus]